MSSRMFPRRCSYFSVIPKIPSASVAAYQNVRNKSNEPNKSEVTKKANVTILGAGGGVGQSLSLLLKISPMINVLKLYDVSLVKGLSEDLSHINTPVLIQSYTGSKELEDCLQDSDIVVITAGLSRKLGMSRDDLFVTNATILRDLVEATAIYSPKALIAIVTNPLNSMVPVACKALQKLERFDARKIFGITTVDVTRTIAFLAEKKNLDPRSINVPVIGGHSGTTIVPVFSRTSPPVSLNRAETEFLTIRVQEAGETVLLSKAGSGTSTVGSAYAAARFVTSLCRGLNGERGVVECAYVQSKITDVSYCASELELGKHGIEKNLGIGQLNEYETGLLEASKAQLKIMITRGEQFGESRS